MSRRQKIAAQAHAAESLKPIVDTFGPLTIGGFTVPAFDGVSAAFGARIADYPPMASIPEEFRRHDGKFQDVFSKLFFNGGTLADHGLKLKNGISHPRAMRAIRAYMSSWDPKHEHKTATVAWALSEWTEPTP